MQPMLNGMCNNIMEHLLDNGFYSLMHVCFIYVSIEKKFSGRVGSEWWCLRVAEMRAWDGINDVLLVCACMWMWMCVCVQQTGAVVEFFVSSVSDYSRSLHVFCHGCSVKYHNFCYCCFI